MVECVADGQGKKPREVMEELGFELDDDRDMLAMGMTSK